MPASRLFDLSHVARFPEIQFQIVFLLWSRRHPPIHYLSQILK
uniref:Uncharacterized protein n=1 Tax=Rhizophora mucronata TaxID=61149 RepID=A0A2P2K685_RHIMU